METVIVKSEKNIGAITQKSAAYDYYIMRMKISFESVSKEYRFLQKLKTFFENPENINYCDQCDKSVSTLICDTCGGIEKQHIT